MRLKPVIHTEDETSRTVMEYQPRKISAGMSASAKTFIVAQPVEVKKNFRLSELVAQQTGIDELEKAAIEKRVEQKALEKLKEIQESAYKEAYEIGLEEGRQQGIKEASELIQARLQNLNQLIERITHIKTEVLQRNENQIIDFLYFMASKVALKEIKSDKDRILPVLRAAFESIQTDENIVIRISDEDLQHLQQLITLQPQEFEYLSKSKFEATEGLSVGGVILETNYGLIDATVEERVNKLWTQLDEIKPNTKKDEFQG